MKLASFIYPAKPEDRSRWILERRGEKAALDPRRPYAFFHEVERGRDGLPASTATIFLTNRECPWRCVMCDLWRNTTHERVPAGAIPAQIEFALSQMPRAAQVKLYNSGSFFDPNAIPSADMPEIARQVLGFDRVIVECHPALVGPECGRFSTSVRGRLEVAMGLETVHPEAMEKLNKRMTRESFAQASAALREMEIGLRVFVLVNPAFVPSSEGPLWVERSIDFALECGATVISLIPTRKGNGALDDLERQSHFAEPQINELEAAQDYGIRTAAGRARIFADLWDLRRFSKCPKCFEARERRLHQMNLGQMLLPRVACDCP